MTSIRQTILEEKQKKLIDGWNKTEEKKYKDIPHGIKPAGHRIVVLPKEVEEKSESGIIINVGTQKLREELAQVDGVVIAMGDTCYTDQPSPWCKVGDTVIFGKYSGIFRKGNDERMYRIVNDLDVVATIEE